jgi:hypothetical protein
MQGTSGLLTFLHHRLGALGVSVVVVVAVAIVLVALALVSASEFLAVGADPGQTAPLRWPRRF